MPGATSRTLVLHYAAMAIRLVKRITVAFLLLATLGVQPALACACASQSHNEHSDHHHEHGEHGSHDVGPCQDGSITDHQHAVIVALSPSFPAQPITDVRHTANATAPHRGGSHLSPTRSLQPDIPPPRACRPFLTAV